MKTCDGCKSESHGSDVQSYVVKVLLAAPGDEGPELDMTMEFCDHCLEDFLVRLRQK